MPLGVAVEINDDEFLKIITIEMLHNNIQPIP